MKTMRGILPILLTSLSLLVTGCATSNSQYHNPKDPWEGFNRTMFSFNDTVDTYTLRPIAKGYDYVFPKPIKTGVSNFFSNLKDLWIGTNNVLQGNVADGLNDGMRFLTNSTFGFLGFLDVATAMKLPKHDQNFGLTLAKWGVGEGNYVVLPFLGPNVVRGVAALPVDGYADLLWRYDDVPVRNALVATRLISDRYKLLGLDTTLQQGALDKYAFVRDFYLQNLRKRALGNKVSAIPQYQDPEDNIDLFQDFDDK